MTFELDEKRMPVYPDVYTHINFLLRQKRRQMRKELGARDKLIRQLRQDVDDLKEAMRSAGVLFNAFVR